MDSSQHATSYTRQPQQPPVFETADELFESIEDLIEKGLILAFIDEKNVVRLWPVYQTEGTLNLVEHAASVAACNACGTLTSEIA